MRIVPQSAPTPHPRFSSSFLMLAALPIAALLPARVPSSIPDQVIVKPPKRISKRAQMYAQWAAEDAELDAFLDGARQRLAARFDEIMRRNEAR